MGAGTFLSCALIEKEISIKTKRNKVLFIKSGFNYLS
jgi:hypothetical protein